MSSAERSRKTVREVFSKKWLVIRDRAVQFFKTYARSEKTERPQKTVFVVFRGGVRAWWHFFLNKDFTHVFMLEDIIKQPYGKGLMQFEFLHSNINAIHLPIHSLDEYLTALKDNGCKVLKIKPFKIKCLGAIVPRLIPFNCVSLVKLYLGIRCYRAITPYRLFTYLLSKPNVTLQ